MNVPLHRRLYRADQVREFDRVAIEQYELPGLLLMKRAAAAMLGIAQQHWPSAQKYIVLCGGGNNGGDGYLFALLAAEQKLQVTVIYTKEPNALKGDAARAWQRAQQHSVNMLSASDQALVEASLAGADLIIDCLLGTGLSQTVRPQEQRIIGLINECALPVLAADIPSGLASDTGEVMGAAVSASVTVTFVAAKMGLCTASGPACCGRLYLSRLGIPDPVYTNASASSLQRSNSESPANVLHLPALSELIPRRRSDAHKGKHGHTLVVGGDLGMGGAVILAARAALYCGSGLVSVATRAEHVSALLAKQAELMVHAVRGGAECLPLLENCSAIVIGPGLGQSSWSRDLLHTVLRHNSSSFGQPAAPLLLDADALNLIAAHGWQPLLQNRPVISTPHPGEAARLLASAAATVQADRCGSVKKLQEMLGGVVLLKGAGTLLCSEQAEISLCPYGNAGMSVGGMGDVLSGVIGALCAQGLLINEAAQLGACLHSAAADLAAEELGGMIGLSASELLLPLRALLNAEQLPLSVAMDKIQEIVA
ncbi:MAG: NAD(P)H-hydrate dehydratase [Pseudomonadales bacterium]